MTKAVFSTRIDPTYDDLPEVRYHFPSNYLKRVEQTIGDWIIYYEPRRRGEDPNNTEGRKAYFATAKVANISQDTKTPNHYYAHIDTSSYMDFDHIVPFKSNGNYYESALVKSDGSGNKGAFRHAVRLLPDNEFDLILRTGFYPTTNDHLSFTDETLDAPIEINKRPIVEQLTRRPFRDRAFSALVKSAYKHTCAMTNLKILNYQNNSEAHAAHIMPVEKDGPDSVRNGICLCRTLHWLFDEGLIGIDHDLTILKARGKIPEALDKLLNSNGKINLPTDISQRPHFQYLKFHRENIFKG